jgi:hypothetical protein
MVRGDLPQDLNSVHVESRAVSVNDFGYLANWLQHAGLGAGGRDRHDGVFRQPTEQQLEVLNIH